MHVAFPIQYITWSWRTLSWRNVNFGLFESFQLSNGEHSCTACFCGVTFAESLRLILLPGQAKDFVLYGVTRFRNVWKQLELSTVCPLHPGVDPWWWHRGSFLSMQNASSLLVNVLGIPSLCVYWEHTEVAESLQVAVNQFLPPPSL